MFQWQQMQRNIIITMLNQSRFSKSQIAQHGSRKTKDCIATTMFSNCNPVQLHPYKMQSQSVIHTIVKIKTLLLF